MVTSGGHMINSLQINIQRCARTKEETEYLMKEKKYNEQPWQQTNVSTEKKTSNVILVKRCWTRFLREFQLVLRFVLCGNFRNVVFIDWKTVIYSSVRSGVTWPVHWAVKMAQCDWTQEETKYFFLWYSWPQIILRIDESYVFAASRHWMETVLDILEISL